SRWWRPSRPSPSWSSATSSSSTSTAPRPLRRSRSGPRRTTTRSPTSTAPGTLPGRSQCRRPEVARAPRAAVLLPSAADSPGQDRLGEGAGEPVLARTEATLGIGADGDDGFYAVRELNIERDVVVAKNPTDVDQPVRRQVRHPGVSDATIEQRSDQHFSVAWLQRGQATDPPMHPVGH